MGITAESHSVAQEMSDLINKGKPGQAFALTYDVAPDSPDTHDANFWFHVALAGERSGKDEATIDNARRRAQSCGNYSTQMEGDFYRDAAIAALRLGHYVAADEALLMARDIHRGDKNREAAIEMVDGRIEFGLGRYRASMSRHMRAETLWNELRQSDPDGVDEQWVLNNAYHRERAASAAHGNQFYGQMMKDHVFVMERSTDPRQRWGARFARWGGKPGIWLFDHAVERLIAAALNHAR